MLEIRKISSNQIPFWYHFTHNFSTIIKRLNEFFNINTTPVHTNIYTMMDSSLTGM